MKSHTVKNIQFDDIERVKYPKTLSRGQTRNNGVLWYASCTTGTGMSVNCTVVYSKHSHERDRICQHRKPKRGREDLLLWTCLVSVCLQSFFMRNEQCLLRACVVMSYLLLFQSKNDKVKVQVSGSVCCFCVIGVFHKQCRCVGCFCIHVFVVRLHAACMLCLIRYVVFVNIFCVEPL